MLLSICIPTYNRLGYLKDLLASLLPQISGALAERVELCVSDNHSTDGTTAYLASLAQQGVRCWTNVRNVGGDRNFLVCIQHARGEYVWLIGDDEIVPSDAVSRVVEILRAARPGLLISCDRANQATYYPDYRAAVLAQPVAFPLRHTLISCNVFGRTLFDLEFAERKVSLNYAHMFGLMQNLVGHSVMVAAAFVQVRPVRAQFATFPSWLCVKQAIYLNSLIRLYRLPGRYRLYAVRLACNLPLEYLSRLKNLILRRGR